MIYICSKLSAPTTEEMEQNMLAAKLYCDITASKTGERAFAPHSFLPMYVDDRIPAERAAALEFGRQMLTLCKEVFVVGTSISSGMNGEIELAKELNIPLSYFEDSLDLQEKLLERSKMR